jgi:hypothetical protein
VTDTGDALRHALAVRSTPTANYNLVILQLVDGKAREALATSQAIADDEWRNAGVAMAEHSLGDAKASQLALDQMRPT